MKRKPRPAKESILSKELRWDIITFGVMMGVGVLILYWLYLGSGITKARTIAFTSLVFFEIVRLQVIRAEYKLGIFSNKLLFGAAVLSILVHLPTIYLPFEWVRDTFSTTPLDLIDWGILVIASAVLFGAYKIVELAVLRRIK